MQYSKQCYLSFLVFLSFASSINLLAKNNQKSKDSVIVAQSTAVDSSSMPSDKEASYSETGSLFSVADDEQQKKTPNKGPCMFNVGNLQGKMQIKYKPETFFAVNSNLLNNANKSDWLLFARATIDLNFNLIYGREYYGFDVSEFFVTIRNKANWGNPETIAQTTESEIKLLEAVFGSHKHFITRHIFWIREAWLKFSINEAFGIHTDNKHFFTLGAFPFELGRGIALGSAYAVNPRFLGFYSDNSIDQYAFGFKFSGDAIKGKLAYDLYAALLENKSDTFTNTTLKILGQEYGRRNNQERGPGKINYLLGGRLKWTPLKTSCAMIAFEPYGLYNDAPEQALEFPADSNTKLGTVGVAGEFVYGDFELGFDTAKNIGRQAVKGWDRNRIEFENRLGAAYVVNTHVVSQDPLTVAKPPKVVYDPNTSNGRATQAIINTSIQNENQNGLQIGVAPDGTTLYNSLTRFRNPYKNILEGWMFVADVAYWVVKPTLKVAAMVGVASGDEDPNKKEGDDPNSVKPDRNFKGFIGLQEIYSGNRVQSAFFLGGAGRVPRPLTVPSASALSDRLPSNISGFTNLVMIGNAVHWYPKLNKRAVTIRPNVLWYWQQEATKAFDLFNKRSSVNDARNYLGCEMNVFSDIELLKDLKMFAVGSVFVPGGHFRDIRGTPLSRDQQKLLDSLDVTGIDTDTLPLLGSDMAYTLNIGLEYRY
jgi:hypothetical protein